MEELILKYLKPELLVLVPVLYLFGNALKKANWVKDKFIPMILGGVGILLSFIYLLGLEGWNMNLLWMSAVQGVLAAAGSVYFNQNVKQLTKEE